MTDELNGKAYKKDKRFERNDDFRITNTGIKVKPFYDPTDIDPFNYDESLGHPGQYPYTRGIYASMYRGKLWTMRQYSGFSTSENTNGRFKYLLEHGQTGLSLALDLPTQLGLDSDDPLAKNDVGKLGVAIDHGLGKLPPMNDARFYGITSILVLINILVHLSAMYIVLSRR